MKKPQLIKLLNLVPFVISLLFYLLTVCPTLYVGDDGEIVSASFTLGICHPPGYPFFTILGKIFTYLPLGNIAYRVNLVAVLFAAFSILFLYLVLNRVNNGVLNNSFDLSLINIGTSLIFAFSLTFWMQSLHSKGGIYTLNTFFIMAIFYCLLVNAPYLFGLLLGLGLTNHHTFAVFIPVFLVYIYIYRKNWFKFNTVKFIVLLFFIGLSVYLYLIIRANAKPLMNWGDPYNLERLINHIIRKQYGEVSKLEHSLPLFLNMVKVYGVWIWKQFTPYLLLLVPFGVYAFFKKDNKLFFIFTITFLLASFGMIYGLNFETTPRNIYVYNVFFIPSYMFIAVYMGFGLTFLATNLRLSYVLPLLFVLPLFGNYSKTDLSKNYIAYNYGVNTLRSIDKNGVLFTEGDNQMFVVAYLQYVDKVRTDVTAYDDIGCIFKNIYGENFLANTKAVKESIRNKKQLEIIQQSEYSVYVNLINSKKDILNLFKKEQHGILYKLQKHSAKLPEDFLNLYVLSGIDGEYSDYLVRDIIAQYYFAFGEYYFSAGEKDKSLKYFDKCGLVGFDSEWVPNNLGVTYSEKGYKEKALEYTKLSISNNPSSAREYANLGVMFYQQGKYTEAMEWYNKAISLDSNYAEAYNGLGTVYGVTGDIFKKQGKTNESEASLNKAISCYETALLLKPDYAEAIANMGIVYHSRGDLKKAIELYNRAIKINPNYADAYNNMGVVYEAKGDILKALESYKKAVELAPKKAEAYHNVGVIYFKQGKLKEAIAEWEHALLINPDYTAAKQNIELAKRKLEIK